MRFMTRAIVPPPLVALSLVALPVLAFGEAIAPSAPTPLFTDSDRGSFYTFLKGLGRDNDPQQVFTIEDGVLRISGAVWGCVTSKEEYRDYRLVAEYRWDDETFDPRKERARDSGILIHSQGEDGGVNGVWMHSIEVQLIEGGSGDLLVVGDGSDRFQLTAPTAAEPHGKSPVFEAGGTPVVLNRGRVNWWGRDPGWVDRKGFRGPRDVEKPIGEWNTLECIVRGDTLKVYLNGVLVNEATGLKPMAGRIQIQSEGAEIYFRRFELLPLDADTDGSD